MIYTIVFYRFNGDGRLVETEEWEFTLRPMELRRKVVRDEFHNNLRRKDLTRKKIDMLEGKNELTDFLHNFVAGIDHKDVRKGEIIMSANYSLQAVKLIGYDLWKMWPVKFEDEDLKALKFYILLRSM